MYKDHHWEVIIFLRSIGPIDIKTQAILRVLPEDSEIQRQELLAYANILRARWTGVVGQDEVARTRRERLWRIKAILARGVVCILDTEKRLDAVLVSAAISHVVVEFNRLVAASVLSIIGEAPCGEKEH